MQVVQPQLVPVDAGPALGQLHLALSQGLDLAALKNQADLEGLEDVVGSPGAPIGGHHRRPIGHVSGFLRLGHRRHGTGGQDRDALSPLVFAALTGRSGLLDRNQ